MAPFLCPMFTCISLWRQRYTSLWLQIHTASGVCCLILLSMVLLNLALLQALLKLPQACSFCMLWHVISCFGPSSHTSLLWRWSLFWCNMMWESMLVYKTIGKPWESDAIWGPLSKKRKPTLDGVSSPAGTFLPNVINSPLTVCDFSEGWCHIVNQTLVSFFSGRLGLGQQHC